MKKIDTTGWARMDFVNFYAKMWDVPVIPIDENKTPVLDRWTPYQTAMPTEEELDEWFVKQEAWGLAIICQNRLFSVDFDTEQVYQELKQAGAFPEGTCIYKSAKGYHAIMRGSGELYSISEHSKQLTAINLLFHELGINATNKLSIMPDTPEREWLELYEEPIEVDYEAWLEKYIGWSKRIASKGSSNGWAETILCPYHEDHTPSLHLNKKDAGFYCHGCDRRGKLTELVEYCKSVGYDLPSWVYERVKDYSRGAQVQVKGRHKEFHLTTLQELISQAGEVSNLIPNMLSRGEILLWYGSPKTGKTMQCQDMAASLILGEPIFGIFPIEKPLRVIYFSYEMSAQELGKRFMIRTKERGVENLRVSRYMGAKFPDLEFMDAIRSATRQFPPDVVIYDPLLNMHSLDENRSQDMQGLFAELRADALKKNYGITIVHHTGVEKQDITLTPQKKRPRGSSAIEGCVDLSVLVKGSQQKYVRTIETDLIRAIGVSDWKHKIVFDPATLEITPVMEGGAYDKVVERILDEVGGEMDKKGLAERIKKRLSMEHSQPYKIIDKAEEAGMVVVRGEDKNQIVSLTKAGGFHARWG